MVKKILFHTIITLSIKNNPHHMLDLSIDSLIRLTNIVLQSRVQNIDKSKGPLAFEPRSIIVQIDFIYALSID